MHKLVPAFLLSTLLLACGGENSPHADTDSVKDSTPAISIPTFDISGPFSIKLNETPLNPANGDDGPFVSILDAKETDTLFLKYSAATPCAECRLETQIWVDSKYKDLVRDTGYGTGDWTAIPLSRLNYNPEKTDGQNIAFYLSVRQYHPVETGNKRFLFNLKLIFRTAE